MHTIAGTPIGAPRVLQIAEQCYKCMETTTLHDNQLSPLDPYSEVSF